MGIQALSDRKNNFLTCLLQQPGLGNIKHKAEHKNNGIFDGSFHYHVIIPVFFKQINGIAYQHGTI